MQEILIVEDSRTQAEELRHILEGPDYSTHVAYNGREALAYLAGHAPAAVITDIVMPEMDGFALCRHIKDDPRLQSTPVILLTALNDTDDVLRGLECGADNFVTKPVDAQYLRSRIQSVLLNRHLYDLDQAQLGLEVFFAGRKHFINSNRLQILNLLLSTYDNAVKVNRQLAATQVELQALNAELETKVLERTAELTESEAHYRRFFEEDLSGDLITTPDGTILACNPAFVRIFGFSSVDEVLACDAASLYSDPSEHVAFLRLLREQGRIESHEQVFRKKDGKHLYAVENVVGTFDDSGNLTQIDAYIFDVTNLKRAEEMLMQAQKMEAIGRLAGGVAHDFNNMLMVIQGFTDFVTKNTPKDHPNHHYLSEVRKATDRATSLTHQLLAFGRKQVLFVEAFSLNLLIEDTAKMLQRLIGEDVRLEVSCAADLPSVYADRSQLVQILMNLAVNARDAMPTGGTIFIETSAGELTEAHHQEMPYVKPGRYAVLKVRDTGSGMDAETLEHLFEPFFTTKRRGEGTGLGLATVYGIVKQTGGYVWCTSKPGEGAEFSVYLPFAGEAREEATVPRAQETSAGGDETILVVEDEEMVRRVIVQVLRENGYAVLEAANGRVAVELVGQPGEKIDLIVSDVVMPEMNGTEMVERVRALHPEVKVIFMSGYADERAKELSRFVAHREYLQKPVQPAKLLATIRKVLDER